jgi:GAF domain-containing protein
MGYMPRAILASPIETGDRLLGVIEILDRDSTRAGSDDDLALLALFARQAALALDASARARRIGDLVVAAMGGDGGDQHMADAIRSAAGADDDPEMTALAAAFAELASAGARERRLAVSVVRAVGDYARERRR